MKIRSSRAKRKLEPEPEPEHEPQQVLPRIKKKLRSELPRRRRSLISPILYSPTNLNLPCKKSGFSAFSVDSSSCSYFGDEVSCDSSRVSVGSTLRKRKLGEIVGSGAATKANEKVADAPFRRSTRYSYCRKKENEGKGGEVEVSESSCVESNSGANVEERSSKLKLKSKIVKGSEILKVIEGNEGSEVVSNSEISCVNGGILNSGTGNVEASLEVKENDVVSFASGVTSCSVAKLAEKPTKHTDNRALKISENSGNLIDANFTVSNSESTIDQRQKSYEFYSDLACTEQFSYDDDSEYSSSQPFNEIQSEFFLENSDLEFSDYTPSIFFDSGSEFSERSVDDSTPSLTFSLLLQYRGLFSRSTTPIDTAITSRTDNENHDQPTFARFENEEDEESYKAFRDRERRQVYLLNYAEKYCSTTEYGNLVLQQRSQMVHWIVEQSTEKKLQQETLFLGVSLLDRFLSKGFFKDKRFLQIVGIACLTLATRIEENQPYNSVRQKKFYIGSNVYNRCEVVAMEWLVQEVLNFQCYLPTIYNFLWFYLRAAKTSAEVEKRAKYLAVFLLSNHEHLCYWPSTVAASLVILASLEDDQDECHQQVIETHIRTKEHDLHECIESLEWLLGYM